MQNKPVSQRKWILRVMNHYGAVEQLRGDSINDKRFSELPEWVVNLLGILMGVSHPGLKVRNTKWKTKDLGKFIGRQYAIERLMFGEVPLNPDAVVETRRCTASLIRRGKKRNPNLDLAQLQQKETEAHKKWRPHFRQFIQETLAAACDRPYVESSAFFHAFAQAQIEPDDFRTENSMGVGDKIVWAMVMEWQDIAKLQSIGELHRVLEKAFQPHGVVVTYKRIEKLCQRIKLKFKDPGRPVGSKTQTNCSVV
jgi:hypothetical protein